MKKTFLICLFFMVHNICGSLIQERKDYLDCVTVERLIDQLKNIEDNHKKFLNQQDYDTMSRESIDFISRTHNEFVRKHKQQCLQDCTYLHERLQQLKKREAVCYFCLQIFSCLQCFFPVEFDQKECALIKKKLEALKTSAESLSMRCLFSSPMDPHS